LVDAALYPFVKTAPGTFFQNSFRCTGFQKNSPDPIECADNTIELLDLNNLQGLWYKENGGQKILKKSEIVAALNEKDFSHFYEKADLIRYREKGDYVFIRAIIEFSNYCSRRCAYCGINADNKNISRYRMTASEITDTAEAAVKAGYKTIVLQSGENHKEDKKELGRIIRAIKKNQVAVTLSIGELSYNDLSYFKECGADRYLLKHETSDTDLYRSLHPDGNFEERIKCLRNIKKLGFEAGGGFMVGLPGQTIESIADDLLLLKELQCDMAGIGPFIPHPDTPLSESGSGSTELSKRAMAIARILLPKANLTVTTALGILDPKERDSAFHCGANVIMKKITPDEYKEDYCIYPARFDRTDIIKDRREIERIVVQTGRRPI